MLKQITIPYKIDIPVNEDSLRNLWRKSSLDVEFYIENTHVKLLDGYALKLDSKSGRGSVHLYFEDIEYGIKKWCRNLSVVYKYLHKHKIFLDSISSRDADFILDEAILHRLDSTT